MELEGSKKIVYDFSVEYKAPSEPEFFSRPQLNQTQGPLFEMGTILYWEHSKKVHPALVMF